MKEISVLGIDLAKLSFSVCGLSASGEVVLRKTFSRERLREFTASLPECLIGMEACGSAHYWGRVFLGQGHRVKMMSVYAVKPFAPPQKKNDASDAQAIATAALQPTVNSVRIKSERDQDLDILRNLRDQHVKSRVALVNQAHAVGLEYGRLLPKAKTTKALLQVLEESKSSWSPVAYAVLEELLKEAELRELKAREIEKKLETLVKNDPAYARLVSIPGVGLLTASAVIAHTGGAVGNFKNGRQFAAYLGLVPRQNSTGGKTTLGRIHGSGHEGIRRLLVTGTRSVVIHSARRTDARSLWVNEKKKNKGFMKTNIAVANKTARIIYAVLKNECEYRCA